MDTEIQTQHVEMQPEWRALIDARLARLGERYPRLIRVHVTLKHGRHHQHGSEEVDIVATYPGVTLRAAKQQENMRDALHAALDALERELAECHAERRHAGKARGVRPVGKIARVFTDHGFILTDEGEEIYFHRDALRELTFEVLALGMSVEVEIERGERWLQATRVGPVGGPMAT